MCLLLLLRSLLRLRARVVVNVVVVVASAVPDLSGRFCCGCGGGC